MTHDWLLSDSIEPLDEPAGADATTPAVQQYAGRAAEAAERDQHRAADRAAGRRSVSGSAWTIYQTAAGTQRAGTDEHPGRSVLSGRHGHIVVECCGAVDGRALGRCHRKQRYFERSK